MDLERYFGGVCLRVILATILHTFVMLSRVQVAALAGRVHNHPMRVWGSAPAAGQGLV